MSSKATDFSDSLHKDRMDCRICKRAHRTILDIYYDPNISFQHKAAQMSKIAKTAIAGSQESTKGDD